jgi:hypothetical protein
MNAYGIRNFQTPFHFEFGARTAGTLDGLTMAAAPPAECIELGDSSGDDSSVLEIVTAPKKPIPPAADPDSDDDSLFEGGPIFSSNAAADASRISNNKQKDENPKRKLTREEREEERRREKEQRQELKHREKLEKQEERNRKRVEKEAAKRAEQESKRRRILAAQQTSGKFASEEICILIEPQLLQRLDTDDLMETYSIHPHSSSQEGTIRWIRRDYTSGGAQNAVQALQDGNANGYQMLDRMVIVFYNAQDFIRMLQRSDEDDDYPLLESWLESLQYKRGKLVLLLHQVNEEIHKAWNHHRRSKQNPPPPTDAELEDAIVWLLIQFQVECVPCSSEESLLVHLRKMTRALSEEPYQQQVTELECIKKLKSECFDTSDAYTKANDTWIRQLQQVPRVSEAMARNLAQYFPTARSLWDAYVDPNRTEEEKRMLLAPLFTEGRQQAKLSDVVYRLITSSNPNELL